MSENFPFDYEAEFFSFVPATVEEVEFENCEFWEFDILLDSLIESEIDDSSLESSMMTSSPFSKFDLKSNYFLV